MNKTALSFDIGGTKLSSCLVNEKGEKITEITKVATPKTAEEIFEYLKQVSAKFENEVDVISIATAGAVNNENTRVVSSTPNLPSGYHDIDFSCLSSKPVFVENDANAAAWCEYRLGDAKNYAHVVVLTIGTGIGGGIIINGKLLKGSQGLAGEVGSIKISYDKKRQCTCGNYDCWESYGSGTGLKKTAGELAHTDEAFKSSIYSSKQPEDVTTYDIISGVKENDEYSLKVFNLWQYHIYCGVLTLVNVLNPELIVFSGGLGEVIETEKMEQQVNSSSVVSDVIIKKSELKNETGMIGAALLAIESLK